VLRRFVAAALLCVVWCGAVFGQLGESPEGQPHFTHVSPGYTSLVRTDCWAPVRITVKNPGPETDVSIVAYALDVGGGRLPFQVRTPLHLPAGAVRKHVMYVRVGDCERLVFEMYDSKRRLTHRTTVFPMRIMAPETLILGISCAGEAFACAQAPGNPARLRFNTGLQFTDLPARMQGYEGVDALLLGSLPKEQVTILQQRAILNWVRAGGLLIVSPGATGHNYQGTLFEEFIPVEILGRRLVEGLPSLEAIYGKIEPKKDRIGLTEAAVKDGTVELWMDQFPLVVSRRVGMGQVVFVAFDLSAQRILLWPRLERFYRDLLARRGKLPAMRMTSLVQAAARGLHESVGVKVMPRGVVAAFLAVNVVMVALLLTVTRRRREYGFLILLLAAPLMALGINSLGYAAADITEPEVVGLHVLQMGSGESIAAGTGFHALLSDREAATDVLLNAEDGFLQLLPVIVGNGAQLSSAESVQQSCEMVDGDVKRLRDFGLRPRAVSILESTYMAAAPCPVEATAVFYEDGILVTVVNRSDEPFERGFVACNRNAAALPDLSPGESAEVRLTTGTARGLMAGYSRRAIKDKREAENDRIIDALYTVKMPSRIADTGLMVFGWHDGEPVSLELPGLTPAPTVRGRALWIVRAQPRFDGDRFLLPKGSLSMRFSEHKPNMFYLGKWTDIYGRAEMDVEFGVPTELRGMKPSRIAFFLRVSQAPFLLGLEALNCETGRYDLIVGRPAAREGGHAEPVETGETTFVLERPERYFSPGRGAVRLHFLIEPREAGDLGAGAVRHPIIEELDMEIEGIRE